MNKDIIILSLRRSVIHFFRNSVISFLIHSLRALKRESRLFLGKIGNIKYTKKLKTSNKYSCPSRDKSKYFSPTFNLKRCHSAILQNTFHEVPATFILALLFLLNSKWHLSILLSKRLFLNHSNKALDASAKDVVRSFTLSAMMYGVLSSA